MRRSGEEETLFKGPGLRCPTRLELRIIWTIRMVLTTGVRRWRLLSGRYLIKVLGALVTDCLDIFCREIIE